MCKPLVFLADDEDFFRSDLSGSLSFFDYEVVEASNGSEFRSGLDKLLKEGKVPDVLIVDNQMPNRPCEPENQWCGFDHILSICRDWPGINLGPRVIFLSRWQLVDLPGDRLECADAKRFSLLESDRWLPVNTAFFILRARIEDMINSRRRD